MTVPTRRFSLPVVLCLAAWWGLSSFATAQEWTRFRGPNGTGHSDAKNIPVQWTEADYNWKVSLPGGGHASPVLWGDKIFLTCADDQKTAHRIVVCLHAKDGRVLWQKKFTSTVHKKHRYNSFASSTPAVDEHHVYVLWSTPRSYTVTALDHAGQVVWQRDLGPYVSQHSSGVSPIVYKDLLIVANDQDALSEREPDVRGKSFLIALDRKKGVVQWKLDRQSARVAYSTPCIYQPPGGKAEMIFNSMSHGMTSINPDNGRVNWELTTVDGDPLLDKRSVSSPVIAGGVITISCGSGAGGNYLAGVRPGDVQKKTPPKQIYKIDRSAPYVPTPIAVGDLLFLWSDGGFASCVDANTGQEHWRRRLGGRFFGSPICVNGNLYCISTTGQVVVLKASKEFQLLAKNELGELSHSTPAVAGEKMYLRTYRHLISIGGP